MTYIKTLSNQNQIAIDHNHYTGGKQISEHLKLRFIFTGKENYQIGKRNLSLFPGSFLVFNEGTVFTQFNSSERKAKSLTLMFSRQFLDHFKETMDSRNNYILAPYRGQNIMNCDIAEKLYPIAGDIKFNIAHLKNYMDNGGSEEVLILDYMDHCLLNCYMIYCQEILTRENSLKLVYGSSRKEVIKRVSLAKEFLQTNYHKKITLEDVAGYSSFSVNHLIRTFDQAFNQTPYQFLMRLRLQRAQTLLKDTEYPINEIANIVGFESTSSFIRLFREYFNITPLKYRGNEAMTFIGSAITTCRQDF